MLYIDWWENSQSYFYTLQALDVSPTCDAADVKSIIQLLPHSSRHVTGNSSHSLTDAPLKIIDIRTLRDFLSIRTRDMDLASVVFVKYISESVYSFLNNPVLTSTVPAVLLLRNTTNSYILYRSLLPGYLKHDFPDFPQSVTQAKTG
jgi:hypothetical protein